MELKFAAILLVLMQALVATFVLKRNAKAIANWDIRIHQAVLGEFALLLVALALAGGFIVTNRRLPIFSTAESFLVAPAIFLLTSWLGQIRLITYLATSKTSRRRFIEAWHLKKICFSTCVHMFYAYACISLLSIGSIYFSERIRQRAEIQTTPASEQGYYDPLQHRFIHIAGK